MPYINKLSQAINAYESTLSTSVPTIVENTEIVKAQSSQLTK